MKIAMPSIQNQLPTFARACADYNGTSRKVDFTDPNVKIVEVLVTVEKGGLLPWPRLCQPRGRHCGNPGRGTAPG